MKLSFVLSFSREIEGVTSKGKRERGIGSSFTLTKARLEAKRGMSISEKKRWTMRQRRTKDKVLSFHLNGIKERTRDISYSFLILTATVQCPVSVNSRVTVVRSFPTSQEKSEKRKSENENGKSQGR